MELSFDAGTAERFARGVWGLRSFIALIIYLRWQSDHTSAPMSPSPCYRSWCAERNLGQLLCLLSGVKRTCPKCPLVPVTAGCAQGRPTWNHNGRPSFPFHDDDIENSCLRGSNRVHCGHGSGYCEESSVGLRLCRLLAGRTNV